MDRSTGRSKRISKRLVVSFLFIAAVFPLYSQDQTEETEEIKVFVYPDKHIMGSRITVSYIIPKEYLPSLYIPDMEFPDGLDNIITPQITSYNLETPEGYRSATRIKMIYRSLRRGIYTLPSFTVKGFEEDVYTPEVILPVVNSDEKEFGYPLYVSWADLLPDKIYTGQTVPLVLLLENMETLSFPDTIKFSTPRNSFLEKVSLITEIESKQVQDSILYNVPIETWMLTPSQSGVMTIPSAEMKMKRAVRKTPAFQIEVEPLPESVHETGAVGDFSFSVKISNAEVEESDTVVLDLILEGSGNFNYLKMPEPVFNDFVLIRKNEELSTESSLQGYKGFLKVSYLLQADKAGSYSIQVPAFRWINPSTDRIETIRAENLTIRVKESAKENSSSLESQRLLLGLRAVQLYGISFSYKNGYMYLILLPGALYLLLVVFFRKFGKKEVLFFSLVAVLFFSGSKAIFTRPYDVEILSALKSYEEEKFQDATAFLEKALEMDSQNPAILYNLGVIYEHEDNPAQAAYFYRKSLKIRPWLSLARKGISRVEKKYILEHQFPLPSRINEDLLFLLSLLCIDGIFFGIAFYLRRRRVRDVILILSFIIIFFPLLGVLSYSKWERSRPYAVVGETGGEFRKVPGEKASDWLTLTPGTTVLIQANVENYYQVRTGYNVKGWLKKEEIIPLSENLE